MERLIRLGSAAMHRGCWTVVACVAAAAGSLIPLASVALAIAMHKADVVTSAWMRVGCVVVQATPVLCPLLCLCPYHLRLLLLVHLCLMTD